MMPDTDNSNDWKLRAIYSHESCQLAPTLPTSLLFWRKERGKIGHSYLKGVLCDLVVIPGRLQSPGTWHFSRLGTSTSPSSIDQPSCFLWLASKISRDCSWPGLAPKKSLPFIPTPTFTLFVRTKNSHIKQHFFCFRSFTHFKRDIFHVLFVGDLNLGIRFIFFHNRDVIYTTVLANLMPLFAFSLPKLSHLSI